MKDTTGQISFGSIIAADSNANDTTNFNLEVAPGLPGSSVNSPGSAVLFDWIQIGLVLYGTTSRFCSYRVELIQFLDPDLDVTNISHVTKYTVFYQQLSKQYVSHPLAQDVRQNLLSSKTYKVIKSFKVNF